MKLKNLLICILILSFILCPIVVFAESIEEDLIITDMTDDELEEIFGSLYASETIDINIAQWNKVIDKTKDEVNGYSIAYYEPVYNNVHYYNFAIIYGGRYQWSGTSKQYRLVYYSDETNWTTKYSTFNAGSIIVLTFNTLEEVTDVLYSSDTDRTEITASIVTSTEGTSTSAPYYSGETQFTKETQSDAYRTWYKSTYNTEPGILKEYCQTHDYEMMTQEATCTQPGGLKYVCRNCSHSYLEETTAKLEHDYVDNVCTRCGQEYIPPITPPDDSGNSGDSDNSGFLAKLNEIYELLKAYLGMPDAGFIAEIDMILMENLEDNGLYTSVCRIERAITDLLNNNYNNPNEFREINQLKLTLRQPNVPTNEYATSYTKSKIDWGINDVSLIGDMKWFFGTHNQTGVCGNWINVDGTYAVKHYSDKILGAILWVSFAFMVWQNFPSIISGEMATLTGIWGEQIRHEHIQKRTEEEMFSEKEFEISTHTHTIKMDDGNIRGTDTFTTTTTKKRRKR